MKECPNCKAVMEDDALFCGVCGTKLEIKEAETHVEEPEVPEVKHCVHCGGELDENGTFCPHCGKAQDIGDEKDDETQKEVEIEEPKQDTIEQQPQPEPSDQSEQSKQQEEPELDEQPTYEWEEEKKSKTWLWILLTILVAGGIGMWYNMSDENSNSDSLTAPEVVDTTPIEETDDYEDNVPTSPLAFLNQFYMGDLNNAEYIKKHVTASVLNKLKRDYEDDCPSNDCLATWVFTAYPPGSDLSLEEGPIITESKAEGKYSVLYRYYSQGQSGRIYKQRGLLFSVTQIDGKYLISDYELIMPDVSQNIDDVSDEREEQYYLRDGRMFLHLEKKGSYIDADFNFRDGTYVSATYYFSCKLDDDNMFSSEVHKSNGRKAGMIKGTLENNVMTVEVGVDNQYSGSYEFKLE